MSVKNETKHPLTLRGPGLPFYVKNKKGYQGTTPQRELRNNETTQSYRVEGPKNDNQDNILHECHFGM
jgi:hypothetical protein